MIVLLHEERGALFLQVYTNEFSLVYETSFDPTSFEHNGGLRKTPRLESRLNLENKQEIDFLQDLAAFAR